MQRLCVTRLTEYRFASGVTLEPHRLRVRQREGHHVHIESSRLTITPAHSMQWHRDVSDDSVAVVCLILIECPTREA